ncbi:hypothetical protein [Devosia nitrariae]|uniref:Anti-sigma factor NepR domain-containing protein n=1 Tax=Devosia nitrariae TaxID=2071872 RepID=A0ABQ5WB15_9HYPH|nr:hypothetical protein [Devosia nitrariae]GLQ57279.1 hypothetical protein GCM10010862_45380 [Devosia nitrariae]
MTYSPHSSSSGSARAAFIARIREIAEEYRLGLGPTASMAEIFAALREYDRRRPQARPHQQEKRRQQP